MSILNSKQIQLITRPVGTPTTACFSTVLTAIEPISGGEVLVKNLYISVDPYMRGRMHEGPSYATPFELGKALEGGALGQVVESKCADFAVGDLVLSNYGWREAFVAPGTELQKVDKNVEPASAWLSVMGMTGMTAWVGLRIADLKADDVVFVSAAAGAVGSVAGQIAKQRGCKVIGSAGSTEKVRMLTEDLGFDAAFNYKEGMEQLSQIAPYGIDVYFDNVGGSHLEAALDSMRPHGRIICCGAISKYNDTKPTHGPSNLMNMIGKRLTMTGFIVSDWTEHRVEFEREMASHLESGKFVIKETFMQGIENAPQAFIQLLEGGNIGKMIVKL
jgi:NADPH-dependent curcumin reductase CurA